MSALLDTSVLVGPMHDIDGEIDGGWAISVVTVGELEAGVLLAPDPESRAVRLRRLTAVLAEAPALAVSRDVATRYGELRAAAGRAPSNDLWIAATALAHGLRLLTADERQAALPLVDSTLLRTRRRRR